MHEWKFQAMQVDADMYLKSDDSNKVERLYS